MLFGEPPLVRGELVNESEIAERSLEAPSEVGRYRIFGRGGVVGSLEIERDAAAEVSASLGDDAVTPTWKSGLRYSCTPKEVEATP